MSQPQPFGLFTCGYCGRKFTKIAAYDLHRVKGEDGDYRCMTDEEMMAARMRMSGDQWFVLRERGQYEMPSGC